jgi:arylsulfatase A-like enzyme
VELTPGAAKGAGTERRSRAPLVLLGLAAAMAALGAWLLGPLGRAPVASFRDQACALPSSWLTRIQRGYYEPRSGQIALLPRAPIYFASGGSGWSHSGPWPYLQRVPLVFFGPGVIRPRGETGRPVEMADVAPTLARLLRGSIQSGDGRALPEVAGLSARTLGREPPRLVLTLVWDGGGWNTLNQWPGAWPNLKRLMSQGVSYTNATVGSSPSVTPSVHTTLGTGFYPRASGITGIPVRDENGDVTDAFQHGRSSSFLLVPALAELWDEHHDNEAEIGMLGYEPWHLGMIGQGAERPGGDRDDAVWLDVATNEWITNREHYRLPASVAETSGLEADLDRLDAADGQADGAWGDHSNFDEPDHLEESPAFIHYHGRALRNMMAAEGYGRDEVTDLLFTNFKQIDRLGHYFNMASDEVRAALAATDEVLGDLVEWLDRRLGRGDYVVVVTADHGQQPDEADIDSYGIDPNELEDDLESAFGPITQAAWPTEVFLDDDAMAARGVTVEEVARWLGGYELRDNTSRPDVMLGGAGRFEGGQRLFSLAIPSRLLPELEC